MERTVETDWRNILTDSDYWLIAPALAVYRNYMLEAEHKAQLGVFRESADTADQLLKRLDRAYQGDDAQ